MTEKQEDFPGSTHTKAAVQKRAKSPVAMGVIHRFPRALIEIARVSAFGATKHEVPMGDVSYLYVPDAEHMYFNSEMRHATDGAIEGTFNESDGGLRHKAQKAWNALADLEVELYQEEQEAEEDKVDFREWWDKILNDRPEFMLEMDRADWHDAHYYDDEEDYEGGMIPEQTEKEKEMFPEDDGDEYSSAEAAAQAALDAFEDGEEAAIDQEVEDAFEDVDEPEVMSVHSFVEGDHLYTRTTTRQPIEPLITGTTRMSEITGQTLEEGT